MSETELSTRPALIVTGDSRPSLPRHVKLRHDAGRGRWIILAPERVFEPGRDRRRGARSCATASAVVGDIATMLAEEYRRRPTSSSPTSSTMLQDLADKGVSTLAKVHNEREHRP